MKTRIISFYADLNYNTYYSSRANILIEKCKKFNIPHAIEMIQSTGSYMLNCLKKPSFIKDMMKKYNEPLIWMDCDTDFREPFDIFDNINDDIGFASHTGCIGGIKASPLYFKNGDKFDLIINTWIKACEDGLKQNMYELDHDALKHDVLPKIHKEISIFIIKENYNDYCNGRFINNGNSSSPDKREVHTNLQLINKKRPSL
jgi:hypothetical protein